MVDRRAGTGKEAGERGMMVRGSGGGALMRRVNPPSEGGGGSRAALCASKAPLQYREGIPGHLGPH